MTDEEERRLMLERKAGISTLPDLPIERRPDKQHPLGILKREMAMEVRPPREEEPIPRKDIHPIPVDSPFAHEDLNKHNDLSEGEHGRFVSALKKNAIPLAMLGVVVALAAKKKLPPEAAVEGFTGYMQGVQATAELRRKEALEKQKAQMEFGMATRANMTPQAEVNFLNQTNQQLGGSPIQYQSSQALATQQMTRVEEMQKKEWKRKFFFDMGSSAKSPAEVARASAGLRDDLPDIAQAFDAKATIMATDDANRTADQKVLLSRIDSAKSPQDAARVMKWWNEIKTDEGRSEFIDLEAKSAEQESQRAFQRSLLEARGANSPEGKPTEAMLAMEAFVNYRAGQPYNQGHLELYRTKYASKADARNLDLARKTARAERDRREKIAGTTNEPEKGTPEGDFAASWAKFTPAQKDSVEAARVAQLMTTYRGQDSTYGGVVTFPGSGGETDSLRSEGMEDAKIFNELFGPK